MNVLHRIVSAQTIDLQIIIFPYKQQLNKNKQSHVPDTNGVQLEDLFPSDSASAPMRQTVRSTALKHSEQLVSHLPSQPPLIENDRTELIHTLTSPQFQQVLLYQSFVCFTFLCRLLIH
jgi:hypothetical protein